MDQSDEQPAVVSVPEWETSFGSDFPPMSPPQPPRQRHHATADDRAERAAERSQIQAMDPVDTPADAIVPEIATAAANDSDDVEEMEQLKDILLSYIR
jgi:hypothetical protein